jgi:hypothetical protein
LWDDENAEEDDENGALSPPRTSEEAEFKRIFDRMVDADYLRYAYEPEFILARRMFKILLNGIDW